MVRARVLFVCIGLAAASVAPARAGDLMKRSSSSPMAGGWTSAMPASGQVFAPGPNPSKTAGEGEWSRRRAHGERSRSAVDFGFNASAGAPIGARPQGGGNPGLKATGWGTGAAGGLYGGHAP